MKTALLAPCLAALMLTATTGSAKDVRTRICQRVPFVSFVLSDRSIVTLDVSPEEIRKSPPWDPDSGKEPPVSMAEALQLASAEFANTVPNPESWMLFRINVEALCDDRAVYMVWWSEQGGSGPKGQLPVPVLMSGVALSTSSAVAAAKGREP